MAQRELDSAGALVGFATAVDAVDTARAEVIATWPREPPGGLNTSKVDRIFRSSRRKDGSSGTVTRTSIGRISSLLT